MVCAVTCGAVTGAGPTVCAVTCCAVTGAVPTVCAVTCCAVPTVCAVTCCAVTGADPMVFATGDTDRHAPMGVCVGTRIDLEVARASDGVSAGPHGARGASGRDSEECSEFPAHVRTSRLGHATTTGDTDRRGDQRRDSERSSAGPGPGPPVCAWRIGVFESVGSTHCASGVIVGTWAASERAI